MADLKISQLTGATTPLAGTETLPVVQSSTTKKVSVADLTNGRLVNAATLQTSGGPVGSLAASKWLIQTEDTTATRSYACGPNTSTYGTWELYLTKATTSPALTLGCYATYSMLQAAGIGGIKVDTSTNTTVQSGNLIFDTAAKGVNFTANTPAAGMTSQLLNWYEEGTWTAVLRGATTAGTYEFVNNLCRYTRVGRLVTLHAFIRLAGSITGGGSGYAQITGLPFAKAANSTAQGMVSFTGVTFTGIPLVDFITSDATSTLYFPCNVSDGGTEIDISGFGTSDYIRFTITYLV